MGESPGASWPSVEHQTLPWTTNPDLVGPDGARPKRVERMMTSIVAQVPASIAAKTVHLSPGTVALLEGAAVALATLQARAEQLSGLGELLVRTEAMATSKIERIYADMDELARASVGAKAVDSAMSTFAAAQALTALTNSTNGGRPLTQAAILEAHRQLLGNDPAERDHAGEYRTVQNWIGGSDLTPYGSQHVPPPPSHVTGLMEDLVAFANRDDLSGIAQAAIAHAQFEAVHPFADGNGRVGRGLIGAVLRRRGLTRSVTVPAAAAMLADVDTYFDHLRGYREGDADSMVAYLARASIGAAEAAEEAADHLAELPAQWRDRVQPRRGSAAQKLLDGLLSVPILDAERAKHLTGASPARTYEALDRLTDARVLAEISHGSRNRIWVASDVMTEVRELEDRIGVRTKPSKRWL